MLIDEQVPPSYENIFIRQSDQEILIVFRGHLFAIISPFSKYLREFYRQLQKHPLAKEIISFERRNPIFLIVVCCSYFAHLSCRLSRENASAATEASPSVKFF
jgi:hypothetical protein